MYLQIRIDINWTTSRCEGLSHRYKLFNPMLGAHNSLLEEDIIESNKTHTLILILLFYSHCNGKLLSNIS